MLNVSLTFSKYILIHKSKRYLLLHIFFNLIFFSASINISHKIDKKNGMF